MLGHVDEAVKMLTVTMLTGQYSGMSSPCAGKLCLIRFAAQTKDRLEDL